MTIDGLKLSVISPVYRIEMFPAFLDTYVHQTAGYGDYEVIFIAANPRNGQAVSDLVERSVTEHPGLHMQCLEFYGHSNCETRNMAAEVTCGDRLLFIDGDQYLHSTLFQKHIENVRENQVGLGMMNININYRGPIGMALFWSFAHTPQQTMWVDFGAISGADFTEHLFYSQAMGLAGFHNRNNLTDYINFVTRNCSMWRDSFVELGGFDESLGYSETSLSRGWEDTELGLRAFKHGMEFVTVPSWTVHPHHQEMMKDRGWGNMITMCKKHPWFVSARPDWFRLHGYDINRVRKECGM
jgi:hypothetical protein